MPQVAGRPGRADARPGRAGRGARARGAAGPGDSSRRLRGARGVLTFFQTFPGFISETFGARRRPSFRLPGGVEVGRARGKRHAEGGDGGEKESARWGGLGWERKTGLQVFAMVAPHAHAARPAPRRPAAAPSPDFSPLSNICQAQEIDYKNPASPRGFSYLGIGGAVLIRF